MLALGFAKDGIDFNAPDGRAAKIVFVLLMPPRVNDQEVRILAAIARAVLEPQARDRLLGARSELEVAALLGERRPRPGSMPPPRPSLADI
jgi:mannitol/fructose-specific phosphotransferase system IIA component (Ntr-type)